MKNASRILALVMALAMVLSLSALASGEPSGSPSAAPAAASVSATESTAAMTPSSYGTLDNFNRSDAGYVYVGYDVVDGALTTQGNWQAAGTDFVLNNTVEGAGFTAVHAAGEGSDVTVTGSLTLYDPASDSQGVHASDFSGVGCAVVLANGATAQITGLDLTTDGFVRAGLIVDNYARAWVKDSSITTYGANPLTEAWEGYFNSANTGMMLSPPWVLGIQGGIRTMNVLDNQATLVVENSELRSGGWGVISTDGCTTPAIYVVDSVLRILPLSEGGMESGWRLFGYDENAYGSGYGSYVIGSADERFYGADISGATFGVIVREGQVSYQSSNGYVPVTAATGEDMGYIQGAGKPTVISAVFGSQVHQNEDTSVSYLDGTIVNTEKAVFLYRSSGHTTYTVDNALLNSKSGVILQMMDDDDMLVGGFSPFNEFFYETAGAPSKNGSLTGPSEYNSEATVTLTNGQYNGDFYNGTGYYGGQAADVMNVNIGQGATVNGVISLTESFHGMAYRPEAVQVLNELGSDVAYVFLDAQGNVCAEADAAFIQFTQFSMRQYYMLCHVMDIVHNNGFAGANVTVSDGGVWKVTGTSIISSLSINGGAVIGELAVNADGSLTLTPGSSAIPAGVYGTVAEANVAAATGMGNAGSGEASGSGESSDEPASGEASGETAPAAAGYTADYAGWLQYLKDYVSAVPAAQEHLDEFFAAIDAGEFYTMPGDMLFQDTFWGYSAASYDDFVAAGGQVQIPAFDPNLTAD